MTGTATAIGHAIAPGAGTIAGALVGLLLSTTKVQAAVKKKVFISFDFENDKTLKEFMIGQAKLPDSPFEVADHSLKEAAPDLSWPTKARAAIARSDLVIVMVGSNTYRAQGVLKEVKMARAAAKPIIQIIGYKDGDYVAVPGAGRLYRWSWSNLKRLLS